MKPVCKSHVTNQRRAYSGFSCMKRLGVSISLDGILIHRRVTSSIKFADTLLYTWVEKGTARGKCLSQEHNTMSPARARTRAARSRVVSFNHKATTPPTRMEQNCAISNIIPYFPRICLDIKRAVSFSQGVIFTYCRDLVYFRPKIIKASFSNCKQLRLQLEFRKLALKTVGYGSNNIDL